MDHLQVEIFNLRISYTRILCITRTVKHNYILPISTVRIELHVSVLYVDHFQVGILAYRLVIKDVWGICVGGRGGDSRPTPVSIPAPSSTYPVATPFRLHKPTVR